MKIGILIGGTAQYLLKKQWNLKELRGAHVTVKFHSTIQKINHFPGIYEICRKDRLARNLNRMKKAYSDDFDFFPPTWTLPTEYTEMMHYYKTHRSATFIIKPESGSRGRGIFLTRNLRGIDPQSRCICQVYVSNPLLIDGYKFDLRIYTLVTSCEPLRLYVYNEGIARFATVKYKEPDESNLDVIYMHLTNYALNKHSEAYMPSGEGSKRSMTSVLDYLKDRGYDVENLMKSVDEILIKTVLTAIQEVRHQYRITFPRKDRTCRCFEILGFDILIDRTLRPFLLEVNHSPSFNMDLAVDANVKRALLQDLLGMLYLGDDSVYKVKSPVEVDLQYCQNEKIKPLVEKNNYANLPKSLQKQFHYEDAHKGCFRKIFPISLFLYKYQPFIDKKLIECDPFVEEHLFLQKKHVEKLVPSLRESKRDIIDKLREVLIDVDDDVKAGEALERNSFFRRDNEAGYLCNRLNRIESENSLNAYVNSARSDASRFKSKLETKKKTDVTKSRPVRTAGESETNDDKKSDDDKGHFMTKQQLKDTVMYVLETLIESDKDDKDAKIDLYKKICTGVTPATKIRLVDARAFNSDRLHDPTGKYKTNYYSKPEDKKETDLLHKLKKAKESPLLFKGRTIHTPKPCTTVWTAKSKKSHKKSEICSPEEITLGTSVSFFKNVIETMKKARQPLSTRVTTVKKSRQSSAAQSKARIDTGLKRKSISKTKKLRRKMISSPALTLSEVKYDENLNVQPRKPVTVSKKSSRSIKKSETKKTCKPDKYNKPIDRDKMNLVGNWVTSGEMSPSNNVRLKPIRREGFQSSSRRLQESYRSSQTHAFKPARETINLNSSVQGDNLLKKMNNVLNTIKKPSLFSFKPHPVNEVEEAIRAKELKNRKQTIKQLGIQSDLFKLLK